MNFYRDHRLGCRVSNVELERQRDKNTPQLASRISSGLIHFSQHDKRTVKELRTHMVINGIRSLATIIIIIANECKLIDSPVGFAFANSNPCAFVHAGEKHLKIVCGGLCKTSRCPPGLLYKGKEACSD